MIQKQKHHQRDAIQDILNPLGGYRGELANKGIKPKNHMKMHRDTLKKQQEQVREQQELASRADPEPFKMKKFQQMESRVKQDINMYTVRDEVRPHTSGQKSRFGARPGSARPSTANGPQKHIAFGRTSGPQGFGVNNNEANRPFERKGSFGGMGANQRNAAPRQADLNRDALEQFDRLNRVPQVEEKMEVIDTSNQVPIQMGGKENQMLPPRTPNYGKTPKYISKYKEEAKQLAEEKEEQRLAKLRPPGTKVLAEPDRIATLEKLVANKKELTTVYNQLPISLRTQNLKTQKIQLEQKLEELDKAIDTFSKKMVYVKM